MLKYNSIIDKLTVRQKLALLTAVANNDPTVNRLGVPAVAVASLEEMNEGNENNYPSYNSLANSWNTRLISQISEDVACRAKNKGVNLLVTPDIKSATNVYSAGLSEDPVLCGYIARSILNALDKAGVAGCVSDFSINEEDCEYLDVKEDKSAVLELYERPFQIASNERVDAVSTSLRRINGTYSGVNRSFFREGANGAAGKDAYLICKNVPSDINLRECLPKACLEGGVLAIDNAFEKYKRLKQLVKEGSVSEGELERAVSDGTAVSEEDIDAAVDKAIDFACRIAERTSSLTGVADTVALGLNAAEQSFVLLKNELNALPLKKGSNVAVVGDLTLCADFVGRLSQNAANYGLNFIGSSGGYDKTRDRSDELIPPAVRIAKAADAVVLFLGREGRDRRSADQRRAALPANQLALIDALQRTGRKIIAVLASELPVDMSFDTRLDGVLLSPVGGTQTAEALLNILSGKTNPSGKLARTLYDKTDELYKTIKDNKDNGRNKVGLFTGYRYYDTAKLKVKYPFGFGLSYTAFTYSHIAATPDEVRVTVKNIGKVDGGEIVQIYAGKRDNAVHPQKQLIAFEKVFLKAGESKTVTIALPPESFSAYDESTLSLTARGGVYTVCACSSVSDVRAKSAVRVKGENTASNGDFSEYLQTRSNIRRENYIISAKDNGRAGMIAATVLLVCLLFATVICDAVIIGLYREESWFVITVVLVSVLMALSVILLLVTAVKRKQRKILIDENDKKLFDGVERTDVASLKELFNNIIEKKEEEEKPAEEDEESVYFDESLNFADVCREFATFSAERGIVIGENNVRSLISAVCASRLIVIKGTQGKTLTDFLSVLCEYFGSSLYLDAAQSYRDGKDLLSKDNEVGSRARTQLYNAMVSAKELKSYVHFACLTHVYPVALEQYFTQFAELLGGAAGDAFIRDGNEKIALPPNLWIILTASEDQPLDRIPSNIAEYAYVIDLELKTKAEIPVKSLVKPISYHQLINMAKRVKSKYELDEALWKKADKLEARIKRVVPYRIGNRAWLVMENYATAYLSCGGDKNAALDSAVAGKLILGIVSALNGGSEEFDLVSALEDIFGEENITECKKVVRYTDYSAEK